MRIMIKGGVWKNTEDEILKAAVMKYGKNQWARISSLLVRKSAKQCKARWYEWLDPSIKKTEWTREEDEKLLHLAKLMPTQWRTIAPIVGRTPSQCLERYEKLLDAACVKDDNYEPGDDPRKLRPGEIDPNPESKPARPDPVDMDEDEKEMLSEARARLANTKGKKAKRKAREKQLEEARRLASLQKKRELKAAGIDIRQRRRKRRGIDYNAEIPFEKRPPPGYFDVADEDRPVEQPAFPTTIEELEGKRRVDVEAQLRKQDVARNKIAERQDAPAAILHANKLNDPETVRKRSKLMLPPPQISDQELDEIAKLGYASDLMSSEELTEGSSATRALLSNYPQTPNQAMTPLRTPQRTPASKRDAIMMEAENLARLRESQTPLLGGENPELHPSDFSGVTPKKKEIHTPNPLLTPSATPGSAGLTPRSGMTPARDGFSFGMTPKGTPLRDELHINEGLEMHDSAKLELRRQADMKRSLRSGLSSLPQPKNEYQIVMQPVQEDAEEPEEKIEEDMSDRMAREKAEEEARQQALLRKRSKVLQRELPRPPPASLELIRNSLIRADGDKSSFVPPTLIEQADEMIRKELLTLLEHDNAKYPLEEIANKERKKGAKRAANGPAIPVIEDFQEDEIKAAGMLIKDEAQYLRAAMGHENDSLDEFVEAHTTCINDLMYFSTRNAYGLSSVAGNMEKLAALQNEFENVRSKLDDGKEKMIRLEKKVTVLTQGYEMRSKKSLWPQIEATFKQMDVAATEFECFQALKKQEQLAASHRINNLWSEVQKQKELERTLQKRYGDLMAELERTQNVMEQFRVQAQQKEEIEAKNHAIEEVQAQQKEEIEAKNHAIEEVQAQQQEETEAKKHVLESTEAKADEINVEGTENCEAAPPSAEQQIATVQDQATSSSKVDMDVGTLPDAPAAEDESAQVVEGKNIGSDIDNRETTVDMSAAVEIKSNEGNGEGQNVENPDEVTEAANQPDSSIKETTPHEDMQVADGKEDEAN
ncbi:Cell cycle serine/threonine-protein kinase cdc5/MSD2, variant 4 [Lathyrus oleraceus]|uniref:Cell cycle serine/threonine-protein kinase cdc5/MSD2, variant 4 n=1 Tax=Pisum sativum TaxID=3888 RepID=A0A9D4XRZ5_PEA|nr:Cell cycle serine/threonine-protein kinase cdc5/MSD2, variant 4 [Pisum sativum]